MVTTSFSNSGFETQWWAGNIRLKDSSGLLLGAHLAHAGLICLWAGAILIKEVAAFAPGVPLYEQGAFLMAHLAALGISVGPGGEILDTYPYFAIGVLHLTLSAVYAAGGLYHTFKGPEILAEEEGETIAPKFEYAWGEPKRLSFILGHHLLFLGGACLLFAANASFGGGIYDPVVGDVRQISSPNLNPAVIGYIFGLTSDGWNGVGMAAVDNMETVIGGHFLVGVLELFGGTFHILSTPFGVEAKPWSYSGESVLSYSLAALGLMGLGSYFFVNYCDVVYAPELFGADRSGQAATQLILGILCYIGHVWHALRGQKSVT
ncbi:MAG: chlorophyll a/b binding light-harvesting protein [Leptolyngbyaceae cyanobacterium MAG.088]|nr:chlorophyll a/b binding light-harvesting protein [Leptolyngbyaceae cyanobacterium MAG.088]